MTFLGYLKVNYCPSVLDTVGSVIWPVNIVPDMTYNVFDGTLNPTLLSLLYPARSIPYTKSKHFGIFLF